MSWEKKLTFIGMLFDILEVYGFDVDPASQYIIASKTLDTRRIYVCNNHWQYISVEVYGDHNTKQTLVMFHGRLAINNLMKFIKGVINEYNTEIQ